MSINPVVKAALNPAMLFLTLFLNPRIAREVIWSECFQITFLFAIEKGAVHADAASFS